MRTVAVALLLVLAGCGGGSDPAAAPTTTPTKAKATEKAAVPKPTVAAPSGTPAPESLSRFLCAEDSKDSKDRWRASGTIANSGKSKATFQVTVYVGEATGGAERARTKQLADIQAGGSAKFVITRVPAPEDGGTCHVQPA